MNPGDDPIVPDIRLERLRSTPVWVPALPSRSIKPASAPAAVVERAKFTSGGAVGNTISLNAFNALSAEGRPSTFGSATTACIYTHRRREDKAAISHQPGRLAVGGRDNVGENTLEGGAAAAGLSFKLWSEGRGGCGGIGGVGGAVTMTTANRGKNDEDDQSSLGTLVGETCHVPSCNAGHFTVSPSPPLVSFEGKGGVGVTIKNAVAAPTSDFGVTTAVRQMGGGSVGVGGVGSEALVVASAGAPALLGPDRPVGRLSCALIQLSTRCVCADERRVLIVHARVPHSLCSSLVVVGTRKAIYGDSECGKCDMPHRCTPRVVIAMM